MRIIYILTFFVFCSIGASAQQKRGVGLSMKALWMDYKSTESENFEGFGGLDNGFELGFHKPLDDTWEIVVPLKLGIVNLGSNGKNLPFMHVDAQIQRHFFKSTRMANPYLATGLGLVFEDFEDTHVQLPLAFGTNVRIKPGTFINFEGSYRFGLKSDRNNVQLGVGIVHYFGDYPDIDTTELIEIVPPSIDSDGDGIVDELDNCPQIAGLQAFFGCPDSDLDGIMDSLDKCPDFPGPKELMGCPDSDGDGLSDLEDECPNIAGPISNKGCPVKRIIVTDRDGDGVPDTDDLCPDRKGFKQFQGCPDTDGDGVPDKDDRCPGEVGLRQFQGCPDSDNDGLSDSQDRCPYQAGPISNQGCPGINKTDQETLNFAMRAVQFEHGSSTIKKESYPIMDQIAEIINRYPEYRLSIEGHTDNTGNAGYNQSLSDKRARKCYEYLVKKGVASSRVSSAGYGETRPIADNNTYDGRTLNRRVEFNLSLQN